MRLRNFRNIVLTLFLSMLGGVLLAQYADPCVCNGIKPFCSEAVSGIVYPSVTSGNASTFLGQNRAGCCHSLPAPAWYYMRIDNPGNLLIYLEQHNSTGSALDVDFVCWGPFQANDQHDFVTKLCNNTYQLTLSGGTTHRPTNGDHSNNNTGGYPVSGGSGYIPIVDCSYNAAATEWCYIPNAQIGQYYLFLITNYSLQPGTISFEQVDVSYATASTDCDLFDVDDNTSTYDGHSSICKGMSLNLDFTGNLSSMYNQNYFTWVYPDGSQHPSTSPVLTIDEFDETMEGVYQLKLYCGTDYATTIFTDSILVQPKPTVLFSPADNDTIGQGETVSISATVTNYDEVFYKWDNSPWALDPVHADTLVENLTLDRDTCFTLRVSTEANGEGCASSDTLCIVVFELQEDFIEDRVLQDKPYVQVQPNPIATSATVIIRNAMNLNEIGCDLYDETGQLRWSDVLNFEGQEVEKRFELDLSGQSSGVYVLKIRSGTVPVKSLKIIKR